MAAAFLLANVTFAIIVVDFLRNHKLLVGPAVNRLWSGRHMVASVICTTGRPAVAIQIKEFLEEFFDGVCKSKVLPPVGTFLEHYIKITGQPFASCFRRVAACRQIGGEEEVPAAGERWDCAVQRSASPWSMVVAAAHKIRKLTRERVFL